MYYHQGLKLTDTKIEEVENPKIPEISISEIHIPPSGLNLQIAGFVIGKGPCPGSRALRRLDELNFRDFK